MAKDFTSLILSAWKISSICISGANEALSPEPATWCLGMRNMILPKKNSAVRKAADKIKADNFLHQRHSVEKQKERHALLSYLAQPDVDEGLLLDDGQPVSVKPRMKHANLNRKKGTFKISITDGENLEDGDKPYLVIKERYIDVGVGG